MGNKLEHASCIEAIRPVSDALEVLNGKWKLPLIISMRAGNSRFTAIQDSIPGITPKVLAKELKNLEIHKIITRHISDGYPVVVSYALTEYAITLKPIINSLKQWGENHRSFLFGREQAGK